MIKKVNLKLEHYHISLKLLTIAFVITLISGLGQMIIDESASSIVFALNDYLYPFLVLFPSGFGVPFAYFVGGPTLSLEAGSFFLFNPLASIIGLTLDVLLYYFLLVVLLNRKKRKKFLLFTLALIVFFIFIVKFLRSNYQCPRDNDKLTYQFIDRSTGKALLKNNINSRIYSCELNTLNEPYIRYCTTMPQFGLSLQINSVSYMTPVGEDIGVCIDKEVATFKIKNPYVQNLPNYASECPYICSQSN